MDANALKTLLSHGTPQVVVVGGGYVGLPFAVVAAQAHCDVTVLDTDVQKVEAINHGFSYVKDVPDVALAELVAAKVLRATSEPGEAVHDDTAAIVICVPTPLQAGGDPDVSFVTQALESVLSVARYESSDTWPLRLISLESTVYPGFTREVVGKMLADHARRDGEDTFLSFSPERVDPGNPVWHTKNTPKVVGANTPEARAIANAFYSRIVDHVVMVDSTDTAEMVKLLENTYRWVNIGLVNEIAIQCHQLGLDVWEVIDAAKTKPFGFMSFVPGPGAGGPCLTKDSDYLAFALRQQHHDARFIRLAGQVNRAMPAYVVQRLADELNLMQKPVCGQRVLVVGVAYKPDVPDTRESPALDVIRELARRGAVVTYVDPHVPNLFHEGFDGMEALNVLSDSPVDYGAFDAAIIVTHHSGVDYARLAAECPLVLDTRGVTRGMSGAHLVLL
jgi:UDP-N-acetyl-D-glucosamine dehydrogenase